MQKTQIASLKVQMNCSRLIWPINSPNLIDGYGIDASPRIGAQDIADERSQISHWRVAMEDLQRGLGLYILRYAIADIASTLSKGVGPFAHIYLRFDEPDPTGIQHSISCYFSYANDHFSRVFNVFQA